MKIFINPGHGGNDPGAVSKNGLKESEVCANICNILANKLKVNGYSYQLYQQKCSLFEVSKEENKSNATLFISVHCNSAANSSAEGVETWYFRNSILGYKIAQIMQKELTKNLGLKNRGVKSSDNLHVLKRTKATAILIELAFISNEKEEKMLKEKPELFANAIWEGIKIIKEL